MCVCFVFERERQRLRACRSSVVVCCKRLFWWISEDLHNKTGGEREKKKKQKKKSKMYCLVDLLMLLFPLSAHCDFHTLLAALSNASKALATVLSQTYEEEWTDEAGFKASLEVLTNRTPSGFGLG